MIGRPVRNNRGMALLLTVLVVSLLMVVIMEFNRTMRSDLQSAVNLREGIRLVYMARSGFNTSLALLYADGLESDHDSLREVWANLELFSVYGSGFFEQGDLAMQVEDLSGRLQINALVDDNGTQEELWKNFLLLPEFDLEPGKADEILDALKDWLDADDDPGLGVGGAEQSYYRSLDPPYGCRNGPVEAAEELLLVKGIDRELLYGGDERRGILEYVTAHGTGKINVNTAPAVVLKSLAPGGISQDLVDELTAYRENEDNDLSSPSWATSILTSVPDLPAALLTTASSHFEIRATAMSARVSRSIIAAVRRDKGKKPEILSWKIE